MILFPNAKINIGLNILSRRNDGYHNLQTLFYPIGLKDVLEFVENRSDRVNLNLSGILIDSPLKDNIVLKAYNLLSKDVKLPGLDIHLHKSIPSGAGLGGGSSDAAFFLKALNNYFDLKVSIESLKELAVKLGADCSFFMENKSAIASGIGEKLELTDLNLEGYFLLLVKPPFGVNTREAYLEIIPAIPDKSLRDSLNRNPEQWIGLIKNDFESTVFRKHPELASIKTILLQNGAVYASMSGSGSSVFGLFKSDPTISEFKFRQDYFIWKEKLT